MSTELYPNAIILPVVALPAVLLDVPLVVWHFSQRNIAAGSLIVWLILLNLMCVINPLIWPRDNITEWWDGNVFCDIQARIQIGAVVALPSCTAMIMRRLAKVMDTRNITVAPSRSTRVRENTLEVLWCWGFPFFMMLIYYIVQPVRYFIFGIAGCYSAYDSSWPSLVLGYGWTPVTMFVAAYYAGLLTYRLHRYRREFHRLIAATNTTKSRFMRLFAMAFILIVIYLPYVLYNLYTMAIQIVDTYSWSRVHGPEWNSVINVPSYGVVRLDKWGEIVTGYVAFFVFGIGSDANNIYRRMLCAIGLGKIFPSLHEVSEPSTSSSITFAKGWCSSMSSKAKSLFSKTDSVTETLPSGNGTRNNSVALTMTPNTAHVDSLHRVSTADSIVKTSTAEPSNNNTSFLARIFARCNHLHPILPLFSRKHVDEITQLEKSPEDTITPRVYARAWSSESPIIERPEETQGVHVVLEVHQEHNKKSQNGEKGRADRDEAWA